MKKIIIGLMGLSLFTVFAVLVLASPSNILYFLNWGEYIDPEVLDLFEEETGIHVVYDEFETNEAMYPKVEAGAEEIGRTIF